MPLYLYKYLLLNVLCIVWKWFGVINLHIQIKSKIINNNNNNPHKKGIQQIYMYYIKCVLCTSVPYFVDCCFLSSSSIAFVVILIIINNNHNDNNDSNIKKSKNDNACVWPYNNKLIIIINVAASHISNESKGTQQIQLWF